MTLIAIIIGIIQAVIFGHATREIVKNKGYSEDWFWWGFFFGLLALLLALSKPDKNAYREQYRSSYRPAPTAAPAADHELENARKLRAYKELLDSGAITQEEFEQKKAVFLKNIEENLPPPPPGSYTVSYEYRGETPSGAPMPPKSAAYRAGAQVKAAGKPTLPGYVFGGWDRESFTMPEEDVVIYGSWQKNSYADDLRYALSFRTDDGMIKYLKKIAPQLDEAEQMRLERIFSAQSANARELVRKELEKA